MGETKIKLWKLSNAWQLDIGRFNEDKNLEKGLRITFWKFWQRTEREKFPINIYWCNPIKKKD